MVQVHVLARVWGFESLLRHQVNFKALSSRPLLRAFALFRFLTDLPLFAVPYVQDDRRPPVKSPPSSILESTISIEEFPAFRGLPPPKAAPTTPSQECNEPELTAFPRP